MGMTHSVHQLYGREKMNSPDKLFRLKACIDEVMKSSFAHSSRPFVSYCL